MMAERMKRGLKAEMEEAREILDAYVEENRALVDLLAKGRGHVQELQLAAAAFQPEDPNEAAMAHVRVLPKAALTCDRHSPAGVSAIWPTLAVLASREGQFSTVVESREGVHWIGK